MAEGQEKEIANSLQDIAKTLSSQSKKLDKNLSKQDRSLQNINKSIEGFNESASAIANAPTLTAKDKSAEDRKEAKRDQDKKHDEEMTVFEEILEALNIKQKDQKKEDESWWEGLFDYGLFSWVMLGVSSISGILVGFVDFLMDFSKLLVKGLLYPFKLMKKGILALGKRFPAIQKIIDTITDSFRNLKAMFLRMGRSIKGIFTSKTSGVVEGFGKIWKSFTGILSRIGGILGKAVSVITKTWKSFTGILSRIGGVLGKAVYVANKPFIKGFGKIWKSFTGILSRIGGVLGKAVSVITKPFKGLMNVLGEMSNLFTTIAKRIAFFSRFSGQAGSFFEFLGKFKKIFALFRKFGRFLGPVVSIVMGLIDAFKGGMKGLEDAGKDASMFKKIGYFIVGALQGFFEGAIGSIISLLRDGLGWILRSLGLDGIADVFDDFFDGIIDGFGGIFDGVREMINGNFWSGLMTLFGGLFDVLLALPKMMITMLWKGVKWIAGAIWDGIVWVFDTITGFWMDIFGRIWDAVSGIFDGFTQIFSGDISGGLKSIATSFMDILYFIPNLIKDYIVVPIMEFFGVNMDSQFMKDFKNMSLGELFMKYVIDPLVDWFNGINWSALNPLNWFGDDDDKKASGGYLRRAASGDMVNGPTLVNEQGPEAYTERKSGKTYLMGGDGYVHNANATKDLLQKSEQSAMAKNEAPPPPMAPPIISAGGGSGGNIDNSTTITNNFIDSYSLKAAVNRSAVLV